MQFTLEETRHLKRALVAYRNANPELRWQANATNRRLFKRLHQQGDLINDAAKRRIDAIAELDREIDDLRSDILYFDTPVIPPFLTSPLTDEELPA
jgi:hypothetical protein